MARKLTEAERHDKAMEERTGKVTEPTREEKKLMQQRQEERKISEENTKTNLLEKFVNFLSDPLAYLHSQVEQGEWANRNERYQLYSLLTAVRTQQVLEQLVSLLSKKK